MEYIIILNYGYKNSEILTDSNGFIETFSNYEDAKSTAMDIVENGYRNYRIFVQCSDERNYVL